MAQDTQNQTQYANSDTGEVPVAPKTGGDITRDNPYGGDSSGGIVRQNPFGGPPTPPPQGAPITIPTQTISSPMPQTPLSTNDYLKYQVGDLSERKDLVGKQAEIDIARAERDAAINKRAADEQRLLLNGDPEKYAKASADLVTAQTALKAAPPGSAQQAAAQEALNTARIGVQMNIGSQMAFAKAQTDAQTRDDALRAHVQQASAEQIDPGRLWNSRSTGQKVLAGIGIILGGIGGGLQRSGHNPAMDVINNAINNDINAQREHIENSWKGIAAERELNNDAFNRDMHRQVWENNYRTASLERVKFELAQSAAQTTSDQVKLNAQKGIADITGEQMRIRNQMAVLGQQAALQNAARLRGLAKDFSADVAKYAEKEGVSFEDAQRAVGGLPQYRPLLQAGAAYTPQVLLDDKHVQMKVTAAQEAIRTGMSPAEAMRKFDLTPGDIQRYNESTRDIGVLVPKKKEGEESPKDLEARTVDVQVPALDAQGQPIPGKFNVERRQAASKEEANIYREKTGAAEQWDKNATELKALYDKSLKSGLTNADLARWQALRSDMVSIYGVMKEGSKKLPNEAEAKRLEENIIGNPPNQGLAPLVPGMTSGITGLTTSTDLESKVGSRINNLPSISNEARKAANLTLTKNPTPATPSGPPLEYDPVTHQPINPGK